MVLDAVVGSFSGIFLQSLGVQDVLFRLEGIGLFEYILPFLLLFTIVYGVLSWTGIFGKGQAPLYAIIAIIIGLLGIRFPVYSNFLTVISPKLGVGLAIILVIVLLIGLFIPDKAQHILGWVMVAVGVVIAIVIFSQTYSILGGGGGYGFDNNLIAWVVVIALIIGVLVVAVTAGTKGNTPPSTKLGRLWDEVTGK